MEGRDQVDYLEGLQSSQKFLVESIACREAERQYEELKAQNETDGSVPSKTGTDKAMPKSTLACEIANVREKIKTFLKNGDVVSSEVCCENMNERIKVFEQQNEYLRTTLAKTTDALNALAQKFEIVTDMLSKLPFTIEVQPNGEILHTPKNFPSTPNILMTSAAKKVPIIGDVIPEKKKDDDDDDIDLFGSDEETEEEANLKAERLKAYENKKAKKPALVAKSSVVLDVKPWDDETDMKELEAAVRKVETDGLKWGAGKLVPLAYGIQKFQIVAIVEDEKVSIDWLQETIQEIEDLVQSVDIAAFNKL